MLSEFQCIYIYFFFSLIVTMRSCLLKNRRSIIIVLVRLDGRMVLTKVGIYTHSCCTIASYPTLTFKEVRHIKKYLL